jgi:uncharacterized protein
LVTGSATALYAVRISHVRHRDRRRAFRHRGYLWLVDLDRPDPLPRWLRPFARLRAADHALPGESGGSIRENLETWLAGRGVVLAGGPVLMLANARVLGAVFNPLTVYWCHYPDGTPAGVVAEVHNTYSERHRYLLHLDPLGRAEAPKGFYVSPFLAVAGHYRMSLPAPGSRLALAVTLYQDGRPALAASVVGVRRPATARALLPLLARHPPLTRLLIQRHGVAMWLRRFPIVPRARPTPTDAGAAR